MREGLKEMEQRLSELSFETSGEGFTDITPAINTWIAENNLKQGLLNISVKHTSCSLTINENADPRVLKDLSAYMKALVPEKSFQSINGQEKPVKYLHNDEGPDDMPAHIRSALTCSCLSLSVDAGQLVLGTWQAVYLWEHRHACHLRKIVLHAIGEVSSKNQGLANSSISMEMSRRNASKLNEIILQKNNPDAWASDEGIETNVDLLIDRIHELISEDDQASKE